ncbi:MAG: hypothetical protein K2I38_06625, partial [Duncaniella sp.]|nr:hypothetical protein [Duncaniella sp.]
MRKTLLTLVAVLLGFSTYAADIVENWEEKSSFGPTTNGGASAVKGTSPLTDIEYSFMRACKAVPGPAAQPAYLSIAGRAGAYVEFALPINCKEIKLKTTINITATGKINILADGNSIQSAYAVGEGDKEYSVEIPEEYRKAGTVYRIARSAGTLQFASFTYVDDPAAEEPKGLSVPYSLTFDEPDKLEGYTSVCPNDRPKFAYIAKGASPVYSGFNCVASKNLFSSNDIEYKDSWFISPAIQLEAGKKYIVKYTVGVTNQERASLGIFYGTEATAEAMTGTALAVTDVIGKGLLEGQLFTVSGTIAPEATGAYNIGFYDNTDKYCSAKTILTNISVTEAASGEMPGEPTDFTAVADKDGALSVALSAKAPTVDVEGNTLKELTALEFLRGTTVIKTIENPTPGETYTYTDNEAVHGNSTYGVRAVNSAGNSNVVEQDVKAGLEIPNPPTDVAAHQTVAGSIKVTWTRPEQGIFGTRFGNLSLIKTKVEVYDGATLVKTFNDLSGEDAELEINDGTADQKFYNLIVYAVTSGGESIPVEVNAVPVGKPAALPYSEDFAGGATTQLLYANNNEQYTASWSFKEGYAFFSGMSYGSLASLYSGLLSIPAEAKKVALTFEYSNDARSYTGSVLTVLVNADGEWVELKSQEAPKEYTQ